MAWRNVFRHRRRSFITMAAIVFSMVLIGLSISVQQGTYDGMERAIVRLMTGDLQIHADGFFDDPSFERSLSDGDAAVNGLVDAPWIVADTRRLSGFGLVSGDSSSTGTLIMGVEPDREPRVTRFAERVSDGRWLQVGASQTALIGAAMAQNLGVALGDTVVVLTQGYRSAMGADLYRVEGLLSTGNVELDRGLLVIGLEDARTLFSMPGRYTERVVTTERLDRASLFAERLRSELDGATTMASAAERADRYEVMTWADMMPELRQARTLDDAGNTIFYLFLLLLLGFEIFNTATMSVMERVREFGVLQSIGMRPGRITRLVLLELSIKVVLGLVLGAAVLVGAAAVFGELTIPVGGSLRDIYDEWGIFAEAIQFSHHPRALFWPLIAIACVSVCAMIYPLVRVQRFSPIQALRYH